MTTEDSVRSRVHAAPPPAQAENQEKCVAEIRRDYIESLNQWLWQCYHWQQVNMAVASAMLHTSSQAGVDINRNMVVPNPPDLIYQVRIPSIPKRIAAEFIDCVILLVAKFLITFIAVEYFELIQLPRFQFTQFYDLRMIQQDLFTYSVAVQSIFDKWPILILEFIHRMVVIIYETVGVWGSGGKGQTIGKYIMHIRVINCSECDVVAPGVLRVRVSGGVGLFWALLRATMKNCGVTFLFPVCATALFFYHKRAVYDQVCRTLVIEELRDGPRIVVN